MDYILPVEVLSETQSSFVICTAGVSSYCSVKASLLCQILYEVNQIITDYKSQTM